MPKSLNFIFHSNTKKSFHLGMKKSLWQDTSFYALKKLIKILTTQVRSVES